MSSTALQRTVRRLQGELDRLHKGLTGEARKEANLGSRISRAVQGATRASSSSTLRSKQREVERLERDLVGVQKKRAEFTEKIAKKTADLHQAQQKVMNAQNRERDELARRIEHQEQVLRQHEFTTATEKLGAIGLDDRVHDAFISHASEDKDAVVAPLAQLLIDRGFDIWYDAFELEVGDSLRRKIDSGLAQSRFGIVVLSPSFFEKNWPQYELDGLVAKEMDGRKVILPLWHRVSKNDVLQYSPTLADRVALSTANYTVEELADRLASALGGGDEAVMDGAP